jgi:hypothetical protein
MEADAAASVAAGPDSSAQVAEMPAPGRESVRAAAG